jgi:hypothetical protein
MTRDNSHHKMYRKTVDGVTTLVTRLSHGKGTIGDNLVKLMAHQCALYPREFAQLVDCTLTPEDWDRLVRERCVGGRNPFFGR